MQIFAHRGYSAKYPENTMAAFKAALQFNIDGIELDVHETKDGALVVIHDEKVNRTTNGKGYVKDYTLKQIQQLDAGSWFHKKFKDEKIPTLKEVLQLAKPTGKIVNIELKSNVIPYDGMDLKVVQLIREMQMEGQIIISSFDHESLQRINKKAPELEIAPLISNMIINPWAYTKWLKANAMHLSGYFMQRQVALDALQQGAVIRVYTINKKEHMQFIQRIGAAGIITDQVEVAMAFVNKI
jgi:glycerophosphoryl diester phosphodiesterase